MEGAKNPTPYPEVNAVLALLLDGARRVLGPHFVGLYLYGSLAGGEFDPGSSDIDFLVVTDEELSANLLPALEEMHAGIAASELKYSDHLEGSYISLAALRKYDPASARHPTIGVDWPFKVDFHDATWVLNRYLVRERGVTLAGPSPGTLIDPVSPDDIRATVRDLLIDRWAGELYGPEWLRPRYYQAFAILTMCRALYALETGQLVSKKAAAAWAQEHLGARWASLIRQALAWRYDHSPGDMDEMLAFIRYAVQRAQRC